MPLQGGRHPPALKIVHDAAESGLHAVKTRLHNRERIRHIQKAIGLFRIQNFLHAVIQYLPANPIRRGAGFDKQFVRDWLTAHWDKQGAPPRLPADVIQKTSDKYIQAYELITGQDFSY